MNNCCTTCASSISSFIENAPPPPAQRNYFHVDLKFSLMYKFYRHIQKLQTRLEKYLYIYSEHVTVVTVPPLTVPYSTQNKQREG